MTNRIYLSIAASALLGVGSTACKTGDQTASSKPDPTQVASGAFSFRQNLPLDSFGIVGIAADSDNTLWLSDADNNRLIHLRSDGQMLDTLTGFDRPMHIAARDGQVLVAEYGADQITSLQGAKSIKLPFSQNFDAPSGIDAQGDRRVVADFYNHRIVYTVGKQDYSFGIKGSGPGEFTYPTDVQIAEDKIWVADAYNHRVQVFDFEGHHLLSFGEAEAINAATGLFVSKDAVYVTDFENSRLLIYSLDGKHLSTISEGLDKPTDVLAIGDTLYVVNYAGRFLSIFAKS